MNSSNPQSSFLSLIRQTPTINGAIEKRSHCVATGNLQVIHDILFIERCDTTPLMEFKAVLNGDHVIQVIVKCKTGAIS